MKLTMTPYIMHDCTTELAGVTFEIGPRRGVGRDTERTTPKSAEFWTLFFRTSEGLAFAVADFPSAEALTDYLTPTQDHLMDAAMSVWEAFVVSESDQEFPGLEVIREQHGMATAREFVANLALTVHVGWLIAHQNGRGFDDAFDWQFCPWFLRNCIDPVLGTLRPDWAHRCYLMEENEEENEA
tara:strand:- start:6333 stop:6884 length:552 start_codon:yes stop_codon:yes gene_type:complete